MVDSARRLQAMLKENRLSHGRQKTPENIGNLQNFSFANSLTVKHHIINKLYNQLKNFI
jgi:hypothetical protein